MTTITYEEFEHVSLRSGKRSIHEAATDVIALEQAQGIEHPWESNDFTDKIRRMQKERQMTAQRHREQSEAIQKKVLESWINCRWTCSPSQ